jgi:hypothetical protein
VLDTTQAATDTIDYVATDQTGLTVPEKQNPGSRRYNSGKNS